MAPRKVSLVSRVARSAALAASTSAGVAAIATSAASGFLLQQAEDQRLFEAGRDLVFLLEQEPLSQERADALVQHELAETQHAGIRFRISEASGAFVAGDPGVENVAPDHCSTRAERQRVCSVATTGKALVSVAALHSPHTLLFAIAALVALLFSGAVTWLWTLPRVSAAIAPFSRLRARVAAIDVDAPAEADLGPPEQVAEVDDLRATIGQLLDRVSVALEQAKRFAANAAHELRTPLTAVHAELELLGEQTSLPADVSGNVASARQRLGELVALVEKLLVLAAPKHSRSEPTEIVSLRDIVEDIVRALPPELGQRVTLGEGDALVRGDAVLLEILFTNAIQNALKFGDRVSVAVAVTERVARVLVDDDGPGLPPADWERVFEPFYRDAQALRRRRPGHGLGLALVRHIAESHGGSASFQPRESRGARLQILLPELAR